MMARKIQTVIFILLFCVSAGAQNPQKMYNYDFKGALAEYRDSLSSCTDSLRARDYSIAILRAENGMALTEYCHMPCVVAKRMFHKDEFHLYYPLPDGAWHETQDSTRIVFDLSGAADTIRLDRRDSLELFPVVIGKERYFASNNLYGMGGYDLYVSRWDDETGGWGAPRNLGFPYSSPYDDFLYVNTEDGQFSMFASNRDCPPDSVYIFVVEYEPNPVLSSVNDPARLREMAALSPAVPMQAKQMQADGDRIEDEQTRFYRQKIARVHEVRDSIAVAGRTLDALRATYSEVYGEEKDRIAKELMEGEMFMASLRSSLDKASRELRDIEMSFLQNGVVMQTMSDPEPDAGEVPKAKTFIFERRKYGDPLIVTYK